jgi:hypothetical protein
MMEASQGNQSIDGIDDEERFSRLLERRPELGRKSPEGIDYVEADYWAWLEEFEALTHELHCKASLADEFEDRAAWLKFLKVRRERAWDAYHNP